MAIFSVKVPDGSMVEVELPETATQREVLTEAKRLFETRQAAAPTLNEDIPALSPNERRTRTGVVNLPGGQVVEVDVTAPVTATEDQINAFARKMYFERTGVQPIAPEEVDQSKRRYGDELVQKAADELIGAGEAALTLGTGATAGTVGHIGGTLKGLAEQLINVSKGGKWDPYAVQASAEKEMGKLTYQPRTEAGRRDVEAIATGLQPLAAVAPLAQTQTMAQAAALSGPQLREGVNIATQAAKRGARQVEQGIKQIQQQPQARLTGPSAGAASLEKAALREAKSQELPAPFKMTKGERMRDTAQLQFEKDTAKIKGIGDPLRQRAIEHNEAFKHNFDAFIDDIGSQLGDDSQRLVGGMVDDVLKARKAKDKAMVRSLYTKARKSEEATRAAPANKVVQMLDDEGNLMDSSVVDYINSRPSGLEQTAVVDAARKTGLKQGIFLEDNGVIRANPNATVRQMELFRREITDSLKPTATRTEIRDATILKDLVDKTTESVAGPLYKNARNAAARVFRDYEDTSIIKRLLETKRGTDDRYIALENVVNDVVFPRSVSRDQLMKFRRLLQTRTGGPKGEGAQAWREVQAQVLRKMRDDALKNAAMDEAGNRIPSPAAFAKSMRQLKDSGKFDVIFPGKTGDQLSLLEEVMSDIFITPPGTINTSETASTLMRLIDTNRYTSALRIVTDQIQDAKLKARVKDALK